VTFKAPTLKTAPFKTREELETEITDRVAFQEILEQLGLVLSFRYQKYRSLFTCEQSRGPNSVVLSLDETPIGNYLEIEGTLEMIRLVADQLGYGLEDFINQSYYELHVWNKPRSQHREMVFGK